jgi:limonene-1,2-epoxide hydrolase
METSTSRRPLTIIERLQRAVNEHDLDAMGGCFHPEYRSEQPIHPDRAFRGREQMRKNWAQIFGAVPDIRADVLRCALDGDTVWTEWDLRGKRADGVPAHTVMVTIAGVENDQIVWMRLYLEQVHEGDGIDAAVRASLGGNEVSR